MADTFGFNEFMAQNGVRPDYHRQMMADPAPDKELKNSMEPAEVGATSYKVYASIMACDMPAWEHADQEAWASVGFKVAAAINAAIDSGTEMSIQTMAMTMAQWAGFTSWNELPQQCKVAWEAVVRHLVNCLHAEPGSVNVAELEGHWKDWAAGKIAAKVKTSRQPIEVQLHQSFGPSQWAAPEHGGAGGGGSSVDTFAAAIEERIATFHRKISSLENLLAAVKGSPDADEALTEIFQEFLGRS